MRARFDGGPADQQQLNVHGTSAWIRVDGGKAVETWPPPEPGDDVTSLTEYVAVSDVVWPPVRFVPAVG